MSCMIARILHTWLYAAAFLTQHFSKCRSFQIDYGTSSSPNRVPKLPPSSSSLSSKPPPPIPPSSSSSSSPLAATAAAGMKPNSHPVTVLQNARHFSNTEVTIAHSRVVQGPSHYRYQHLDQELQPAPYYHQHGHGGRQQVAGQQQPRHHRHQYHLDQVRFTLWLRT